MDCDSRILFSDYKVAPTRLVGIPFKLSNLQVISRVKAVDSQFAGAVKTGQHVGRFSSCSVTAYEGP